MGFELGGSVIVLNRCGDMTIFVVVFKITVISHIKFEIFKLSSVDSVRFEVLSCQNFVAIA